MPNTRHRRSAIRAAGWCLIAASVAVLVLGGIAMAAKSVHSRATIQGGSSGSATAKCKHGRSALSGGFAAPGFTGGGDASDASAVARFASKRVGKRAIAARAFNFGDQSGNIVSFAYCGKPAHPVKVRSKSARLQPASVGSTVARCRRGSVVVGGGFGSSRFSRNSGPRILALTSKRHGRRGWKVIGFNIGESGSGGAPGRLTAFAYCQRSGPKLHTKMRRAKATAGTLRTVKVRCPRGATALAGGFDGSFTSLGPNATAAPAITSKRASLGHAWATTALNATGTGSATFTAYAYCKRH